MKALVFHLVYLISFISVQFNWFYIRHPKNIIYRVANIILLFQMRPYKEVQWVKNNKASVKSIKCRNRTLWKFPFYKTFTHTSKFMRIQSATLSLKLPVQQFSDESCFRRHGSEPLSLSESTLHDPHLITETGIGIWYIIAMGWTGRDNLWFFSHSATIVFLLSFLFF